MAVEFDRRFIDRETSRILEILDSKKKVGFDADQVLIASEVPAVERFNLIFNSSYRPEDIDRLGAFANWAMNFGFPEKEALALDNGIWTDGVVLSKSGPVPKAREVSWALYCAGAIQHIITSRLPRLEKITREWFRPEMLWIPLEGIHVNRNKNVKGEVFKAAKIVKLKLPIFFEDLENHAKLILKETEEIGTYVVLVPYRRTYTFEHPRLIKLPSMQALYEAMVNQRFSSHNIDTSLRLL